MNELEQQLRAWVPRRPSARVRQSLFPSALATATASSSEALSETSYAVSTLRFAWLAPAMAGVLVMAALFNQPATPGLSGSANSAPFVAMILSNQSATAYFPGGFQREQNRLPETFEWTNGSHSTSSISSLSRSRGKN